MLFILPPWYTNCEQCLCSLKIAQQILYNDLVVYATILIVYFVEVNVTFRFDKYKPLLIPPLLATTYIV